MSSSSKIACVPLPWCTSKSTIATRSSPSSRLRRSARRRRRCRRCRSPSRGRRARGARAGGRARSRRAVPPRSRFPPRAAPPRRSSRCRSCRSRAKPPVDRPHPLHVLARVAEEQLLPRSRLGPRSKVLVGEQRSMRSRPLRMVARRVEARERLVRQDVDRTISSELVEALRGAGREPEQVTEERRVRAGAALVRGVRGDVEQRVDLRRRQLERVARTPVSRARASARVLSHSCTGGDATRARRPARRRRRGRDRRGRRTPPPMWVSSLRGEERGRRRPSSRFAGRAASPPPPPRSGRRRGPPPATGTARRRSAAFFGPIPRAPGSLSDGSPRSAIRSGTCAGLDAVAPAHLGGADPRQLAHASRGLQDRHPVARQLERIAVGGRDEHRPRPRPRRRGEEVVRLVPGRLRDQEAHRLAERGQHVELLEDRLLEHAARLVRRDASCR